MLLREKDLCGGPSGCPRTLSLHVFCLLGCCRCPRVTESCPHLESFELLLVACLSVWAGHRTLLIKILLSQVRKRLWVRACLFSSMLNFLQRGGASGLYLGTGASTGSEKGRRGDRMRSTGFKSFFFYYYFLHFEKKSSYGGMISGRVFNIWVYVLRF